MEDLFCCYANIENTQNESENAQDEKQSSTKADFGPTEWEINEWCIELRENEIVLNEINLRKKITMLNKMQKEVELKRLKLEKEMVERGKGLTIIHKYLATRELEIEVKGLDITVRKVL